MFWEVLRPGFEPGSVTLEFRSGNFSQFEDERPLCFSGSIPRDRRLMAGLHHRSFF